MVKAETAWRALKVSPRVPLKQPLSIHFVSFRVLFHVLFSSYFISSFDFFERSERPLFSREFRRADSQLSSVLPAQAGEAPLNGKT